MEDGVAALSEKVDSYYAARTKNPNHREPGYITRSIPPYLTQPFQFFGSYVALNLKEKASVSESSIVTYYKQSLIELDEKNKVLEFEISLLKDLNLKYHLESSD